MNLVLDLVRRIVCRRSAVVEPLTLALGTQMADPDDEVKANSYTILENVFLDAAGVAAALEERLISRLMLRGQNEENPALLVKALTALSHVVGDKMGIATLIERGRRACRLSAPPVV